METDRGWAWVVLVASIFNQFMNGVLVYFVGVIHTGLLHKYHASVTETAWVGALYSSNMCLGAPLAGLMINRFGCRVTSVCAGVLTFIGFAASAFVPSISWLFLTYGIIAGLGLGFAYTPAVITVGYYFDKFRGVASGFSVCFGAVGILSGSLIAQALIDAFAVSGAFLMLAAISLHYSLFGMFFRPTEFEPGWRGGGGRRFSKTISIEEGGEDATKDGIWAALSGSKLSLAMHGVEIVRATSSVTSVNINGVIVPTSLSQYTTPFSSALSIATSSHTQRPGYFGSSASLIRRAHANRIHNELLARELDNKSSSTRSLTTAGHHHKELTTLSSSRADDEARLALMSSVEGFEPQYAHRKESGVSENESENVGILKPGVAINGHGNVRIRVENEEIESKVSFHESENTRNPVEKETENSRNPVEKETENTRNLMEKETENSRNPVEQETENSRNPAEKETENSRNLAQKETENTRNPVEKETENSRRNRVQNDDIGPKVSFSESENSAEKDSLESENSGFRKLEPTEDGNTDAEVAHAGDFRCSDTRFKTSSEANNSSNSETNATSSKIGLKSKTDPHGDCCDTCQTSRTFLEEICENERLTNCENGRPTNCENGRPTYCENGIRSVSWSDNDKSGEVENDKNCACARSTKEPPPFWSQNPNSNKNNIQSDKTISKEENQNQNQNQNVRKEDEGKEKQLSDVNSDVCASSHDDAINCRDVTAAAKPSSQLDGGSPRSTADDIFNDTNNDNDVINDHDDNNDDDDNETATAELASSRSLLPPSNDDNDDAHSVTSSTHSVRSAAHSLTSSQHSLTSSQHSLTSSQHSVASSKDPTSEKKQKVLSSEKNRTLKTVDNYIAVLTNKGFMFHCLATLASNVHVAGVYMHLIQYTLTLGSTPTRAASLFVAVGVMSLLGRVAAGFATTDPKIDPLTLNMGMMGLTGVLTALFPLYSVSYIGQLAFAAQFGLYTGGQFALLSILPIHFLGIGLLPTAFGTMVFCMGVGYLAGPPLAALIIDSGGTYEHCFVFIGLAAFLGSICEIVAAYFVASRDQHDVIDDVEVEVASINRDWMSSSLIISIQETGSAHVRTNDVGSALSVRSRFSHDLNE